MMSQTEAIKYFPVGSKWMSLKTKEKCIIKEHGEERITVLCLDPLRYEKILYDNLANAETQLKYLKKIHCKFVMKTPVKTHETRQ